MDIYLCLLHASLLQNLLDDFLILVRTKLLFQGLVRGCVEDALCAVLAGGEDLCEIIGLAIFPPWCAKWQDCIASPCDHIEVVEGEQLVHQDTIED